MQKIIRNAIQCNTCGDIIESEKAFPLALIVHVANEAATYLLDR